jgi:peroxiredoxin
MYTSHGFKESDNAMARPFALIAALAVLGSGAVGIPVATRQSAGAPPTPPGGGASADAAPGTVRPGAMSVDDALKQLDLIRPPRLRRAGEFSVPMLDGKQFRLSEHRGKTVLVNFWATWCPPCRDEMPAMERLYSRHRQKGFALVAVSVDADPAVVGPFVKQARFTFPIGLDPKMELANMYGVRALPSSFIIDRQGNLAALALGPRAWDNQASHALVEGMVR